MSRDLRFRVWDKERKKFLNDVLIPDLYWSFGNISHNLNVHSIRNGEFDNWYHDVVIQQFTGLYDINKKGIYEGDIVEFSYKDQDQTFKGFIEWFIFSFTINRKVCAANPAMCENFKIIGNIFEHKELLE